ncbi:hypothetical protein B0H14DRAFT_2620465, partial [Mycena olivaceomarginata]
MCRYTSGYFYRTATAKIPLLLAHRDPTCVSSARSTRSFRSYGKQGKKYGFSIALPDTRGHQELVGCGKRVHAANPDLVSSDNTWVFLSDDGGQAIIIVLVLMCVFASAVWSNFEIANLDFWRGEAYTKFSTTWMRRAAFIMSAGVPTMYISIAAALLARKDEI